MVLIEQKLVVRGVDSLHLIMEHCAKNTKKVSHVLLREAAKKISSLNCQAIKRGEGGKGPGH